MAQVCSTSAIIFLAIACEAVKLMTQQEKEGVREEEEEKD